MLLKPLSTAFGYNDLAPISRGMVALYPFSEGNGDKLTDLTNNRNHGDLFGPKWVGSEKGQSLNFNGTSDYINVGQKPTLLRTGEMSVAVWVNDTAATGIRTIIGAYGLGMYICRLNTVGHPEIYWGGAVQATSATANVVQNNGWHHLVYVRSGSAGDWSVRLYYDGNLDSSFDSITTNPGLANNGVQIGRLSGSALHFWKGQMSDLMFYDRPLNDREAKQLFVDSSSVYEI